MPPQHASHHALWRFGAFVAFVVVTAVAALWRVDRHIPLAPDAVRDAIRGWGPVAPLVFTAAFVLRPFIFFPSTLLFLAGGLAFGVAWGTFYAAVGGTLGALTGFAIARLLGRDFVRAHFGSRLTDLEHARWSAGLVFLLNLIPIFPMTAINYGAGLAGMSTASFTLAVAAGLTPRAFAYSFFGHSLLNVGSGEFVGALALLLALLIVPLGARRLVRRPAAGAAGPR